VQRLLFTGTMVGALLLPMPAMAAASPDALSVNYTSFSSPVRRGHQASVTIHSGAHYKCSIKVVYANGTSHATGLGSKYTNVVGQATWTWKVPKTTRTGKWPVTVTCQSGSHSGHVGKSMTITA
jgi:hypothetical protein